MQARARAVRGRFVAGSLSLHALLLGVAALRHAPVPRVLAHRVSAATEIELDFSATPTPPPSAPVTSGPEPLAGSPAREPQPGRLPPPVAPAVEPALDGVPDGRGSSEALDAPDSAPAPSASAGARLSLAELGVEGPNPFLDRREDPAAASAAKAAAVKRRLDRALAQGLTDADVQRGRGAHGPVLRSLEAAVYASSAPLNGQASFVFVLDGSGKLLSATLGDATGDRAAWLRVAQQTAKSLGKNPALKGGPGVKLTVAVSSHLELPSGADPGLEISAQGVPLKKGGGPRSTRLDLSIFPFPAATLAGDPADIGARPRRMVHARVVREELL